MKVWSLFITRIFKNIVNNYSWTIIIWWKRKRKVFTYFMKCYWIKNILSTVIQNKKYLVAFHKHEINSLHVYYLISCVIFGLFFWVFFSFCKIEYFGTLVNISSNMFLSKKFSTICVFKSFKNLLMFFIFSLKDISSLTIVC